MASFRTCLAKVKKSGGTGSGADEVYKPNWFGYEKMATHNYSCSCNNFNVHFKKIFSSTIYELRNNGKAGC